MTYYIYRLKGLQKCYLMVQFSKTTSSVFKKLVNHPPTVRKMKRIIFNITKIVGAFLVIDVLNKNIYSYLTDYKKVLLILVFDYFILNKSFIFVEKYIVQKTYYCELCDKSKKYKNKHSKSKTHKILDEAIIGMYIIFNPNISEIDEILKKYINISNKKYERKSISCKIKLLTTNHVRYFRIITKLNLEYIFNFSKNSICSRINQDRYYFSHKYEMRITLAVFLKI